MVRRAGQSKPYAAFQFPTAIQSLDLIAVIDEIHEVVRVEK